MAAFGANFRRRANSVTAYAGATHLLGLVHGHWDIGVKGGVDTAHDAFEHRDRINTGIAIVVPILRVLEIVDYPKVRNVWEKMAVPE